MSFTIAVQRVFLRKKSFAIGAFLAIVVILGPFLLQPSAFRDGQFYEFRLAQSDDSKPQSRIFRQVLGQDTFLYSAIVNTEEPEPGEINIIISAFDSSGADSLKCCVLIKGDKLYTTQASIFFKFYVEDILGSFLELFKNAPTKAKQYACVVPELGLSPSHVTLTASVCPAKHQEYLPLIYPKVVPGGMALCAKAAFGDQLDPNKLMEWFEVQRLLGVDHIQLMDLKNPERIQKVFRYYTDLGLLNALPYELPGPPPGRGLATDLWALDQISHDETFPILDCKQRLRGYTYIMGHDMDEIVVPAKTQSLKDFMREELVKKPDAAGFYFYTQFFVYDWGPTVNEGDISIFRYLNSTIARDECKKYIYLTSRVVQARTHTFTTRGPYKTYFVEKKDAILHHYRQCPHVWSTCNPPRITDKSILRFQGVLEKRLEEARKATGIYPKPDTKS